mmetsp:Transcript_30316/g.59598  ORF Transcript_30316/g.59598 Transcript_30316/m.59598 type:complete len:102 (-) Transcript_30316:1391-1696(-)
MDYAHTHSCMGGEGRRESVSFCRSFQRDMHTPEGTIETVCMCIHPSMGPCKMVDKYRRCGHYDNDTWGAEEKGTGKANEAHCKDRIGVAPQMYQRMREGVC